MQFVCLIILISQLILTLNMQVNISQSTKYRFKQSKRQADLEQYRKLKAQYMHYISKEQIQALKCFYLHGIVGKDKNNHTIVIDKIGSVKMNQIMKVVDEQSFIIYFMQRLFHISEEIIRQKEQIIWVIDLNGKIMQLASKKVYNIAQKIIKNCLQYFPNILSKLIFVNIPILFDTVWNNVVQFIPQQTQNKCIFLSQLEELYNYINPNLLPQFLGGQLPNTILENKQEVKTQQSPNKQKQQQQQFDYSSLKNALNGLNFGGNGMNSVVQTPLNTQADDR